MTVAEACEVARFPGLGPVGLTASLLQGTAVSSVALLASASSSGLVAAGLAGLLWCAALIAAVAIAMLRLPRRFVRYRFTDSQSAFSRWRHLLPCGLVLPSVVRKSCSKLVAGCAKPTLAAALAQFVSPVALASLFFIPPTASAAGCQAALWASCCTHVAAAAFIFVNRPHRCLTAAVLEVISLLMTAVGHVLTAAGAPLNGFLVLQSAFVIARSAIMLGLEAAENRMQCSAASLQADAEWTIGDGGAAFEGPRRPNRILETEDGEAADESVVMVAATPRTGDEERRSRAAQSPPPPTPPPLLSPPLASRQDFRAKDHPREVDGEAPAARQPTNRMNFSQALAAAKANHTLNVEKKEKLLQQSISAQLSLLTDAAIEAARAWVGGRLAREPPARRLEKVVRGICSRTACERAVSGGRVGTGTVRESLVESTRGLTSASASRPRSSSRPRPPSDPPASLNRN
jgi:hypothetical protein